MTITENVAVRMIYCTVQTKRSYEPDNTTKGSYPIDVKLFDIMCRTAPHMRGSTSGLTLLHVQHPSKLSDSTTNNDISF